MQFLKEWYCLVTAWFGLATIQMTFSIRRRNECDHIAIVKNESLSAKSANLRITVLFTFYHTFNPFDMVAGPLPESIQKSFLKSFLLLWSLAKFCG
jgi:hypothetical protein